MKFKRQELKKSGVVRRLLHYYSLAMPEDIQHKNWYLEAHRFCKQLSDDFGVPLFQVVGVCAALSPQKNWQENKKLVFMFLRGSQRGHFKQQILKAQQCMVAQTAEEIFNLLTKNGMKTSWFYWNILYPDVETGVTIDRHAIGACVFSPTNIQTIPDGYGVLTVGHYKFFSECYASGAKIQALRPHEFQAIVWSVYRRLKELPTEYQTEPF